MINARDYLTKVHLDFTNNYLTVDKYAEHNGLRVSEALALLKLAKTIFNSPHPES